MKKRMLLLMILIVAVTIGILNKQRSSQQENIDANVKIYGTVDIRDISLAFSEQERITEVLVEEGDNVTKGQVLARLNSSKLETSSTEITAQIGVKQEILKRLEAGNRPEEIDQARADVEITNAQVENSQLRIARLEQTATSGSSSQQDIDDARALLRVQQAQLTIKKKTLDLAIKGPRQEDIDAARLEITALEASLARINIRRGEMDLKAPATGIIQSRILEPGEIASPLKPVLIMATNSPKWVRAYVSEQDLGRMMLGQTAQVTSDSFPEEPVSGWVGYISSVAEFTPRAVQTEELRSKLVYKVRILVNDDENRLRLGMPVTVVIGEKQTATEPNTPDQGA